MEGRGGRCANFGDRIKVNKSRPWSAKLASGLERCKIMSGDARSCIRLLVLNLHSQQDLNRSCPGKRSQVRR